MFKEGTPLADIMIEYGESIGKNEGRVEGIDIGRAEGKAEGKAEERKAIDNQIDEALKTDPTMSLAEFKKQISKNKNED